MKWEDTAENRVREYVMALALSLGVTYNEARAIFLRTLGGSK